MNYFCSEILKKKLLEKELSFADRFLKARFYEQVERDFSAFWQLNRSSSSELTNYVQKLNENTWNRSLAFWNLHIFINIIKIIINSRFRGECFADVKREIMI